MASKLCMGCMNTYDEIYDVCPHCGYRDNTPAKEAYHLKPGTILNGNYIIGKVIGYGGFGVTYIGFNMVLDQKVAIKEYLPSEFATRCPGEENVTIFSGDKEEQFAAGIIKFVEEAKKLAKFKDVQGIVSIYDSFMSNSTAYIVMEYLEGETLKEKIEREKTIPVDDAIELLTPVLEALKIVHQEGILHRDISPDNIFVTTKGEVKLLDFGAARFATTSHSRSLSVIIKPGYAPQEQYRSRGDQGSWTDVYACAATLYKLVTGITPEDSMERGNKDTLLPPNKTGVKIPKSKENAIMNALNLRIEDRTQTIAEFQSELVSDAEIKRKKMHNQKADFGQWPLWAKISTGVVAAAIVTFIVLLGTGVIDIKQIVPTQGTTLEAGQTYVPNVINYGLADAESIIDGKSLIAQIVDKKNSDIIPKDLVLSQSIEDGTVVPEGVVLELVVSAGREVVYMVNLEGMMQDEAMKLANDMGLEVEIIEEESELAKGSVISQDIIEGEGVEVGTTIVIKVSKGSDLYDETKEVEVPNVVGKTWEQGKKAIQASNLYIFKKSSEYSDTVPKGQIISQDITAGTKVTEGTTVGVVVSLGKEMTRVPDVQFQTKQSAESMLSNANLRVDVKYEDSDTVAKDHVIRQSVAAGTEVEMQTVVTIWLSKGNKKAEQAPNYTPTTEASKPSTTQQPTTQAPATQQPTTQQPTTQQPTTQAPVVDPDAGKVTVPNLSGKTESEAKSALTNAGLKVGTITYEFNESKPNGKVLSQSVSAASKVNSGTSIDFVVCNNPDEGKIPVPNLAGKTESEARTALTNAGLSLGSTTKKHDESSSTGTILSQDISSGTKVASGTKVNVVICDNTTVTEYRYRTKITTTSTSSSMSGWTLYDSKDSYGSWGSWSDWSTTKIDKNDTRDVETKVETSYYNDPGYEIYGYATPPGSSYCVYRGQTGSGYVCWVQQFLHDAGYGIGVSGNFDDATHNAVVSYQSSHGLTADGIVGQGTRDAMLASWREIKKINTTYYRSRTRSKTTTYYFEKWSDWSSWSTDNSWMYSGDSSEKDIEQREVFKY